MHHRVERGSTAAGHMQHHTSSTGPKYSQPYNWWGYRSSPDEPLSIAQLIDQGALDSQLAAFLWIAMEQRASLIVAAEPKEAGKTTMLTALLDFLRPEIEAIYLRGWYERFEFLEDERDPAATYLLSNEISSHLPIYMWGRGVRRMFEAAQAGYGIGATVHAQNADGVLRLLSSYPLEVPDSLLETIDLVLTLSFRRRAGKDLRRVMRLELIESQSGRPAPRTLASRDVIGTELQASPGLLINALVRHFGLEREYATSELAQRVSWLDRLVRNQTFSVPDVRRAIGRYRESVSPAG